MPKYLIGIGSQVFQSIAVEASTMSKAKEIALKETYIKEPFIETVQETAPVGKEK